MATRVQRRRTRSATDTTADLDLSDVFEQWAVLKNQGSLMTTRQNQLRDQMQTYLQANGEKDDKGSLVLALPAPIKVGSKEITHLKRERRVSAVMDEERAQELLTAKGLLERAQKTITVLDHDEVYLLHQQDLLTEEEIDSLIVENVSWAFVPVSG